VSFDGHPPGNKRLSPGQFLVDELEIDKPTNNALSQVKRRPIGCVRT